MPTRETERLRIPSFTRSFVICSLRKGISCRQAIPTTTGPTTVPKSLKRLEARRLLALMVHHRRRSHRPTFHQNRPITHRPMRIFCLLQRPFGASADVTYAATVPQTGSFAISPFYQFKSVVGQIAKATRGPYERKRVTFRITLSTQQFESLKGPNATHTLLLLCSPFEQYSVSSVACPAPIEFPSQAEVRVNDKTLTHSFKGTKKYPGRVAPPDLKNIGDTLGDVFSIPLNTIEFWYVCATRDYACAIVHVEKIPVEKLVAALQDNILSKESVLATMKARAQDDDIVAGAATVSLKDPLSLMKMTKPARSKNCDHVQCFDPMMFLRTHEQSPSWSCPICSNKIRWSDVIIDEYMSDIIANVGKDVELVIVEPDGSWHVQGEESPEANTPRRKEDSGVIMDQPTNANPSAIDLRDVEDSPPNPVTARISRLGGVSRLSGSGVSTPGRSSDVIDLTADSDDDEPAILLPPMTTSTIAGQKRPAEEELLDSKGMVGRFPAPKRSHSSIDPNDRMANGSTLDSMGSGNGDGADGPQTASQRSRLADGSEVSPETMDRFFRADSPADVSGDRSGT
ncbi:hypothetical protein K437DRAFT_32972 [Tilletiaria anomala UBC 951]|uniref:SP-RING-type domain-containing protein n=1 Tax=Tilletiaria anomala (strain ATCC 24038 / CBS 436.72 / UBC 951) TaxID=1037660 RepID=A0A066WHY8_TILAU|nr:uncharacterized protein K437DRAFT_32972 [Tilletiaria anomala UBC 951]KDN52148.1 hypothetical protein K437DRAFT_32972 [Tilletiaria anomala UBC 951]